MHTNVQSRFIHKIPKLKSKDNEQTWYNHQRKTVQQQKAATSNAHSMDESQTHYTEQKKLETEEYIHYGFILMTI